MFILKCHKNMNLLISILLVLNLVEITISAGSKYDPKSMDYELRRPITYFYNRLAYKFDVNPYTSHLIDTYSKCSSKTGPFCGFLNGKQLMQNQLVLKDAVKQMHTALVYSAPSSRQVAFQIQKGQLDVFLISSQTHKNYDKIIKALIDKDFYQANPSNTKAYSIHQVQMQETIKPQGTQTNTNQKQIYIQATVL